MLAVGLCSITALGGRRWSAPCWQPEAWVVPSGLELLSSPWLPLYQDHSEEVFSSLVLFACVSSLSLHSVQHATWGHSGCMVADEVLSSPEAPSSHFHSAFPTPSCGRPSLQTTISQNSRKTGGTLFPFSPVSPNSVEWEFCHPSPQMWPNMATQSQLALFFPDNFVPSSQIQKEAGEE